MRERLRSKVAIVTGGASGIGAAVAERFAGEGATVVVLDLADGADVRCDVTDRAAVDAAFAAVVAEHGRLDILVNSAGIAHVGTVATTTEDDLDRVYAVNVKGVANCLRAAVVHMGANGGGAICNLASIASVVGIPDRFAYSMSKGAVLTMTLLGRHRLPRRRDPLQRHLAGAGPHAVRRPASSPTTTRAGRRRCSSSCRPPSRSAGWADPTRSPGWPPTCAPTRPPSSPAPTT